MSRFEAAMAERYGRVADVVDARGRTIGVRHLRPFEQMRIFEFADPGDLVPEMLEITARGIEKNRPQER